MNPLKLHEIKSAFDEDGNFIKCVKYSDVEDQMSDLTRQLESAREETTIYREEAERVKEQNKALVEALAKVRVWLLNDVPRKYVNVHPSIQLINAAISTVSKEKFYADAINEKIERENKQ